MRPQNEKRLTLVHGDFKGANYFLKNEGKLNSRKLLTCTRVTACAAPVGMCVILPFEVFICT